MGKDIVTEPPNATQRKKSSHSCDPCRRRKVKCNEGRPCGNCINSSIPEQCTYDLPDKRKLRTAAVAQTLRLAEEKPALFAAKILRLKARVAANGGTNTPSPRPSPSSSAANIHAENPALMPRSIRSPRPRVCLDHAECPESGGWARETVELEREVERTWKQFDLLVDAREDEQFLNCPSCNEQGFHTPAHLKDHLELVHGQPLSDAHKCHSCNARFAYIRAAEAHRKLSCSAPRRNPNELASVQDSSIPQLAAQQTSKSFVELSKDFRSRFGCSIGPIDPTHNETIPPDVTGLSKRETLLVMERAEAYLSRQRKREEDEAMEQRVEDLEAQNKNLLSQLSRSMQKTAPSEAHAQYIGALVSRLTTLEHELATMSEAYPRSHSPSPSFSSQMHIDRGYPTGHMIGNYAHSSQTSFGSFGSANLAGRSDPELPRYERPTSLPFPSPPVVRVVDASPPVPPPVEPSWDSPGSLVAIEALIAGLSGDSTALNGVPPPAGVSLNHWDAGDIESLLVGGSLPPHDHPTGVNGSSAFPF